MRARRRMRGSRPLRSGFGYDALVRPDVDLLGRVSQFVYSLPQGSALEHRHGRMRGAKQVAGDVRPARLDPSFPELLAEHGRQHDTAGRLEAREEHGLQFVGAVPIDVVADGPDGPVTDMGTVRGLETVFARLNLLEPTSSSP